MYLIKDTDPPEPARERPHWAEDDDAAMDPALQAELLKGLAAILSPIQRRLIRRARHVVVIAPAGPEPGPEDRHEDNGDGEDAPTDGQDFPGDVG
jgi:hypothetical protein